MHLNYNKLRHGYASQTFVLEMAVASKWLTPKIEDSKTKHDQIGGLSKNLKHNHSLFVVKEP